MSIPAFGLGTFRLQGQVVIDSVSTGLELGYRVIDTAQIYENEAEVGEAIAASGIAREELFITSKIWVANFARDRLIDSLKESLQKLQTDYLDLTLIHWPSPEDQVPVEEFMGALLEAKQLGLTRQIGVSNFTVDLMKQAIAAVGAETHRDQPDRTAPVPAKPQGRRIRAEPGHPDHLVHDPRLRRSAERPGDPADRRSPAGDAGTRHVGLGHATGLRRDSLVHQTRQPAKQPASLRD